MKLTIAPLILIALLSSFAGQAQETSAEEAGAPPTAESRAPRISEIMVLQQMRHIKLWFAGRAGNWPLADYETDALKQGFDDVSRQIGGDTVEMAIGAPISSLEKTIETKDRGAFTAAYDRLTAGCNSCHRTLDHAFIVIQRPSAVPYSDQSFAVQK
jgi:hypothetical protein